MNGWPNITVKIGATDILFRAPLLPSERFALVQWYMLALGEAHELLKPPPPDTDISDEDRVKATARAMLLIEGATGYALGSMYAGMEGLDAFYRWRQHDKEFDGIDGKYLAGRASLGAFCERYGLAFEHAAQIVSALVAKVQEKREPSGPEVDEVRAFFGHPQADTT